MKKITKNEVAEARTLLRQYKDGKKHLESRIVTEEEFWKRRHWEQLRGKDEKTRPAIVPAVLEKAHFEQVWSDAWWYKLKHGCAAYGVFWDSSAQNGLGDVQVTRIDLLNIFWEPGITDIQKSRNIFIVDLPPLSPRSAAFLSYSGAVLRLRNAQPEHEARCK